MANNKNADTRASMQNVAAYAGVSIATVSKVMQGVPTVLPENVTKVQNAIEALGYRINPLGAELRRGRRNLVGVIVPSFSDPETAALLTELELAAESRNYVLFIACSHMSEAREAELAGRMQDWRVAGVVVVSPQGQTGPAALLLESAATPTVFVQPEHVARRFDTVTYGAAFVPDEIARSAIETLFKRVDQPDAPLAHIQVGSSPVADGALNR